MPVLMADSRFRQFRVRLKNDRFLKLRRIYSPEQLKKELDKFMPEDCYQTIATFQNPELMGAKHTQEPSYPLPKNKLYLNAEYRINKILNNNLLKVDYLMDFDLKSYVDQNEMLSNVSLARLFLQEHGMKEHILMKTPSGGRQLLIADFDKWANVHEAMPSKRESAYLLKMKQLTEMLKKAGVEWDWHVSNDTRRICRVPNSVRLSTGVKVSLIDFKPEYLTFAR